jgi:hypothetical protein
MAITEATRPAQEEANGSWQLAISQTNRNPNPNRNAGLTPLSSVFLRVLCGKGFCSVPPCLRGGFQIGGRP